MTTGIKHGSAKSAGDQSHEWMHGANDEIYDCCPNADYLFVNGVSVSILSGTNADLGGNGCGR
jgi:hypothetical protein